MTRVAIVGAGAAGLVGALRAKELGATVVVYESSPRAGGAIETHRRDGWIIERGALLLPEPSVEARRLLDSVGRAGILARPSAAVRTRYLVHHGKPIPVPMRVADLVSSPLLSLAGRMRLIKEPFVERGRNNPEETVDSFVRRRLGAEAAERFIDPYLAGTSGGDPKALLARYVLPKLVEYEHVGGSILKGAMRSRRNARRKGSPGGSWSCQDGLGSLIDLIVTHLNGSVRLNTAVHRVQAGRDGFQITMTDGSREHFEAVVLALPAPALGRLAWEDVDAEQMAIAAAMPHTSMVVMSLGFKREDVTHPLDGFGLLAATAEQRQLLGVTFASSLLDGRAPDGHVLLTATLGGARRPDLASASDDVLIPLVLKELKELLGVVGLPVITDVARWPEAMPQTVAGHAQRLAAASEVERGTPGLALAGAWRDGLGVGEAMQSGIRAVERVLGRAPSSRDGEVS